MTLSAGMTYALAAALAALSVREAFAPRTAARGYGVPIAEGVEPTPYLEVKANRDLVLAGLLVVVAAASESVRWPALLISTFAPLADAYTVMRHGKPSGTVVHVSTAAYTLVAAALAAAGH